MPNTHTPRCAVKYIHTFWSWGRRALRAVILQRHPASNWKDWWDRKRRRRRRGLGGGCKRMRGNVFHGGPWIDEETTRTEEALLRVSFRGGGRGLNMPAERWTGFFQQETPSQPSQHSPISSSFSHTALPSGHGHIMREKQPLERDKSTLLSLKCPHSSSIPPD